MSDETILNQLMKAENSAFKRKGIAAKKLSRAEEEATSLEEEAKEARRLYQEFEKEFFGIYDYGRKGDPKSQHPWDKFLCEKQHNLTLIKNIEAEIESEKSKRKEVRRLILQANRNHFFDEVLGLKLEIRDFEDKINSLKTDIYDIRQSIKQAEDNARGSEEYQKDEKRLRELLNEMLRTEQAYLLAKKEVAQCASVLKQIKAEHEAAQKVLEEEKKKITKK